jgi:hypothetical protein
MASFNMTKSIINSVGNIFNLSGKVIGLASGALETEAQPGIDWLGPLTLVPGARIDLRFFRQ